MSVLSLVMVVVALAFLYLVIRQINKNAMLFEQAFVWLVIGCVLLVISLFNDIPIWIGRLLGFELVSNFLLVLAVFFLLVTVFMHTVTVSKQKEEVKFLVQEVSLLKKRLTELEEKDDN